MRWRCCVVKAMEVQGDLNSNSKNNKLPSVWSLNGTSDSVHYGQPMRQVTVQGPGDRRARDRPCRGRCGYRLGYRRPVRRAWGLVPPESHCLPGLPRRTPGSVVGHLEPGLHYPADGHQPFALE